MSNLRRQENGQMAILLVMILPVVFLLMALPLDAGIWFLDHRVAQNQADAAALAAVQYLPATDTTLATAAADTWLVKNGSGSTERACLNYSDLNPVDGLFDTIEVCVRRESPSVFSGLAGLDGIWISASSTATAIEEGEPVAANFVALNPDNCSSLVINSNGQFTSQGPILINSNCNNYSGVFGCNTSCQALSGIHSVGGVETDANCSPCEVTTIPPFADPLAGLLPPCFPNSPVPCNDVGPHIVRSGTPGNPQPFTSGGVLEPGIYYGGIKINSGSMKPGVYIMAGGGFEVNASALFLAPGVFIYNTSDPDCLCGFGQVIINTNAPAEFSPMTGGPYDGLLFFQDRANTLKAVFNTNAIFGEGSVYFSAAQVDLNPNNDVALQIIADTITVNNNGNMNAYYEGIGFFMVTTRRTALIG